MWAIEYSNQPWQGNWNYVGKKPAKACRKSHSPLPHVFQLQRNRISSLYLTLTSAWLIPLALSFLLQAFGTRLLLNGNWIRRSIWQRLLLLLFFTRQSHNIWNMHCFLPIDGYFNLWITDCTTLGKKYEPPTIYQVFAWYTIDMTIHMFLKCSLFTSPLYSHLSLCTKKCIFFYKLMEGKAIFSTANVQKRHKFLSNMKLKVWIISPYIFWISVTEKQQRFTLTDVIPY